MGASQRNKGARGEREIATRFTDEGFRCKRMVGQYHVGSNAPDVMLEDLPNFWIEVKRGARTNIRAALRQAEEAKPHGHMAVAVTRDDNEPSPVVSLRFEEFAHILRKAYPDACTKQVSGNSPGKPDQEAREAEGRTSGVLPAYWEGHSPGHDSEG